MNPASNLVLVGPMGAGKSSIGRRVAQHFGLAFVDADRDIELRAGAPVGTIFECEGEQGFRSRESAALQGLLAHDAQLVATGGGAVLDPGNRARMQARGFVVHLQVDVANQLQRLARDRTRPLLQRDDREQVLQQLAAQRTPLYRQVADLAFDTNGLSCDAAAHALSQLLERHWQRGVGA